jgi:death-on-curing protein
MDYLSVDDVLAIHLLAIEEFGGAPEILSRDRLEPCIESPSQTMFGGEPYPEMESKAGILFFLLVKNHPFMDGNKRTAALALLEFLERNGYALRASDDELYTFTIDVATSVLDKEQVTEWIQARMKPV